MVREVCVEDGLPGGYKYVTQVPAAHTFCWIVSGTHTIHRIYILALMTHVKGPSVNTYVHYVVCNWVNMHDGVL